MCNRAYILNMRHCLVYEKSSTLQCVVKDYQKLKPIIVYEFYNRKPMLCMHITGNCDTKWDIEVFEHYRKCDTASP
mgnify:CR=1 FL=1